MQTSLGHLGVERSRLALFAIGAFALYAVLFDQGALTGGTTLLHEVFHDGRHLLGIPCH